MDKRSRALYTDAIYQEVLKRFDISPDGVRLLDGFESFIYEYDRGERSYILRVSHSLHMPPNRTRGEMDFLKYLHGHGMAVPNPLPSLAGNLVEVIEVPGNSILPDDSTFAAVTYEKAPGGPPRRADWTPELFFKMGKFMGRLHALSKQYQPSRPEWRRHNWYEDEQDYAERYLPAGEERVAARFHELVDYLKALPRNPDVFGLIHIDFHGGNFFLDDGKITLFDFDDCAYAQYAYDIAMALFYVVPHHCEAPADLENARLFYQTFMRGYLEENQLDRAQLKEIPRFLKLREMDLYIIIHRSFDLNNLGRWEASFMQGRKERIENDVPYVPIDFEIEG